MTRATLSILGICLVYAGQEQPTFRAGTTLVEFTYVATDGKGNPVTDLTKEEILVTENGRPRELAFLRFEGRYTPGPPPLPPGEFTNRGEFTPGAARNVTAIVLDAINVMEERQASMREDLMRYLDSLPSGTRAALFRMGSQLTVLDDFTEDVESLRAHVAASKLELPRTFAAPGVISDGFGVTLSSGSPEMAAAKAEAMAAEARALEYHNLGVQDDRIARTLAGLEAIGDHLAGIPGRKNLVWVGSGLPLTITTAGWPKSYEALIRRTAQRLASQGVTIYSVVPVASVLRAGRVGNAVDIFASVTGGRVARVMNDPTPGIRLAGSDSRSTYSVGFYSEGEPDDRWHSLNLKSKRPGVKVLYRQGYLAERATPESHEWTAGQWTASIHGALGSSALRIDARAIVEGETIRMQLQIPVEDVSLHQAGSGLSADLEIAIAEKARSGETGTQKLTVTIRAGEDKTSSLKERLFRHQLSWKLKPGTDTIRIVVRDRHTGRYGTVDLPVQQIPARP